MDETARLRALAAYGILDTPPEPAFDDLATVAAEILQTPIALVSLVDERRQWFKSHHGTDATETPREFAFCAHVVFNREVLVVADSTLDQRFFDNPLVVGSMNTRFYAGTPLITRDGYALGTLCGIDHIPRRISRAQLQSLQHLGRQVVDQMELGLAREQALAAAASRAEFFWKLSFGMRTELNGVTGIASLLIDTSLTPEQRGLVTTIKTCCENLATLIDVD